MSAKAMMANHLAKLATAALLAMPGLSAAEAGMSIGFQAPQTIVARQIYELHTVVLWICVLIAFIVFGIMFYSIVRHRRSTGRPATQFDSNKPLEIVWTVIPCLIVAGLAYPATRGVVAMKDTSAPDLTIKVTGYQWKWRYDYLGENVSFYSDLATPREQIENKAQKGENYLLEVDRPLVVPVAKKVRLLLTANDVIHGWYVPALGVKQDAIPGFVRDTWFKIDAPGIYRGQCTELCGKDHGFMPVVVEALPEEKYHAWLAAQQATSTAAAAAAATAAGNTYSIDEWKADGEKVYARSCAACHQANGQGVAGAFPALAHGAITTGPLAGHIDIVMNGSKKNPAMAAWKHQLSDLEIAAVITYERSAFGNTAGDIVQPSQIASARN
jgi:cytochrome c oxidase subunit II